MKKTWICTAITVAAAILFTVPSYAAGNKISTIRLEVTDKMQIDSALDEDEEFEVETSAKDYVVSGWEFMNGGITWSATDIPEVEVTLITEDDSYFSVPKSNVKLRGDEAEVVSLKKESSQELVVTLRLLPMSQRVGKIAYAEWNGKQAVWAPSEGAVSYEIYLFRDSRAVGSKKTTSETFYDFGVALNKEGEYYYKVRPVGAEGAKQGVLTESESMYRSEDMLAAERNAAAQTESEQTGNTSGEAGSWIQDGTDWRFLRADGTQPQNDWLLIHGKWYYFEEDGRMKTGWLLWKDAWYYLGPDGDMWVNTQTPDGYVVNQDGIWVS